ncbi:transmembrane protein 198 [Vanessa tameamea]|uniref:Transmembrane protein 198 n=2 Tax=Vanessa TaxID=42274 RepID=A0A8B8IU72_VANTA|nr:transmembrane protein 198 [Vanessa tameamea]XP_026500698.1 transmembrane protein 198 [Vanessa tameamea]XP_047544025.1 transmembrane protein 198 isoform X1 [Vanessa atalanta]XP_047544026.1 transmembrane protein 198 isoform X1 [Vanessa atalanta]
MSSVGQLVPQVTRGPPNMTIKFNGPHIEGSFCSLIDYNYDPIISVICAMYIIFGIVYTLFGYRCFKASMFLTGFTFGSAIVYLICLQEYLMPPYGNVGVAVCAGLLFGLITMLIQYVGLFMTGFHTGLLLAIAGLAIYDHFLESRPNTYWLCVVVLLVSGIFFAVVNLYWKKVLTVFGTSVYGGAVIATCLDYFLERMVMLKWLWERAKLEPVVVPPCRLSWLALAAWPAATIVGFVAQGALTAAGTHHEQSIGAQKRRLKAQQSRPVTREQRAEMKQRKYRYLYQVRTAHGDVISQSYVQALQKKAQCGNWSGACGGGGGGECSTLQSDSTHLTVLAPPTDSDDDLNQIRAAH